VYTCKTRINTRVRFETEIRSKMSQEGRLRTLVACDACKVSKRKCNGDVRGCVWCLKYRAPCIYSPNKKRGPRASHAHHDTLTSLKPQMPIGRPAFAAGPEPPGISLDDLHATLRFANRIFRTVNESNFVLLLTEGASEWSPRQITCRSSGMYLHAALYEKQTAWRKCPRPCPVRSCHGMLR